jgi:thiamine kinase-like enzyme
MLGRDLPSWLPRPQHALPRVTWSRVAAESDDLRTIAAMAIGHEEAALDWLRAALPLFSRLADSAADISGPYALLHGDTRSDNLRFTRGRLALFDWPSAEVGRPELDLAAFAQSIAVEGGPDPDQFVAWYGERLAVDADALDAMIAWIAAFFADLAWRPDIPGLPRLRRFQRQQLAVVLAWAARCLRLPAPIWLPALSS